MGARGMALRLRGQCTVVINGLHGSASPVRVSIRQSLSDALRVSEQTANMLLLPSCGTPTCRVICSDLNGIEHMVEATADSLYEALAQGLRAFRDADWAGNIGHGWTKIRVIVKQPEVQHTVRMRDFEAWPTYDDRLTGGDDAEVPTTRAPG